MDSKTPGMSQKERDERAHSLMRILALFRMIPEPDVEHLKSLEDDAFSNKAVASITKYDVLNWSPNSCQPSQPWHFCECCGEGKYYELTYDRDCNISTPEGAAQAVAVPKYRWGEDEGVPR